MNKLHISLLFSLLVLCSCAEKVEKEKEIEKEDKVEDVTSPTDTECDTKEPPVKMLISSENGEDTYIYTDIQKEDDDYLVWIEEEYTTEEAILGNSLYRRKGVIKNRIKSKKTLIIYSSDWLKFCVASVDWFDENGLSVYHMSSEKFEYVAPETNHSFFASKAKEIIRENRLYERRNYYESEYDEY